MSRDPVALSDAVPETVASLLHWDEPDAGCVACGERVMTIDDHRCWSCRGLDVQHCPLCLGDIGALVDREVARRLRQMSVDISEEFRRRNVARRIAEAQAAIAFRQRVQDGAR